MDISAVCNQHRHHVDMATRSGIDQRRCQTGDMAPFHLALQDVQHARETRARHGLWQKRPLS